MDSANAISVTARPSSPSGREVGRGSSGRTRASGVGSFLAGGIEAAAGLGETGRAVRGAAGVMVGWVAP